MGGHVVSSIHLLYFASKLRANLLNTHCIINRGRTNIPNIRIFVGLA